MLVGAWEAGAKKTTLLARMMSINCYSIVLIFKPEKIKIYLINTNIQILDL